MASPGLSSRVKWLRGEVRNHLQCTLRVRPADVRQGTIDMAEKTIPNEEAIINEIVRRKTTGTRSKRIPSAKMEVFKAKLGDEIKRAGRLRLEFVDGLLEQLKNGEL